jgi:hypothetical protein
MKQNVTAYDFHRAFEQSDSRKDQFSYQGLNAIYDYLIDFEDGTGEEVELDVIAICCDFTEYDNLKEFQSDYSDDYKTIEDIEERTTVLPVDGDSFIIEQF